MKSNKVLNVEAWIAALSIFLLIPPYFMWDFLNNSIAKIGSLIFVCVLFYRNRTAFNDNFKGLRVFFLIVLLYYTTLGILNEQSSFFGVISDFIKLSLVSIPFASVSFSKKVYNSFFTIYIVVMLVSLSSYICAHIGIISPIEQIQKLTGETNRIYNIYPLLVSEVGFDFLRFYGPFNEPGVVGTLAALLLCIQRFDFKDWRTTVLLVSGLLSMSFFFFILVIGYGLVYIIMVKRNFLYLIIFTAFFALFYIKTKEDPLISTALWERFEWDDNTQSFKGDNRQNYAVDTFIDRIKNTSSYWFGCKGTEVEHFWNIVGETSSYKVVIVNKGVIFLVMYLLFFVFMGLKHKKSSTFYLFIAVLIANTYQRPDIYSVLMIFIYSYFARFSLVQTNQPTKALSYDS